MSSWSSIALIIRMVMFSIISLFSLFILGIDAHIASVLSQDGIVNAANVVTLVIALLTLLTLPPLLAISIMRKGHIVNMIAIELGVMAVFWILWIAASATTTNQLLLYCDFGFGDTVLSCSEPLAVQAFAWLNWVIITKYILILLILAILQHVRGNPIWTRPVTNVDLFAPRVMVATGPVFDQKTGGYVVQQPGQYPLQGQHTGVYTPQQTQMGYPPASGMPSPPQNPNPANTGYRV